MQPGLEQEGLGRNSEIRAGKGARSSAWRRSAQGPEDHGRTVFVLIALEALNIPGPSGAENSALDTHRTQ